MISKQSIITAVQSIQKQSKRKTKHRGLYPEREWFILLTAMFIIGALVVAWSAQRFVSLLNDSFAPSVTSVRIPTYNQEAASEALRIYNTRSTAYESTVAPQAPTMVESTVTTTTTASSEEEEVLLESDVSSEGSENSERDESSDGTETAETEIPPEVEAAASEPAPEPTTPLQSF